MSAWSLLLLLFLLASVQLVSAVHEEEGSTAAPLTLSWRHVFANSSDCLEDKLASQPASGFFWRLKVCEDGAYQFSSTDPQTRILLGRPPQDYFRDKKKTKTSFLSDKLNHLTGEYVFKLENGETCGVGGQRKPRETTVAFQCCPSKKGRHGRRASRGARARLTWSEPHTCSYFVRVCLPSLCASASSSSANVESPPASPPPPRMSTAERLALAGKVKEMFSHAYDSYMDHAFPYDELRPVACRGSDSDLTAGGMLTLIESLDTLAAMGNTSEFFRGIELVTAREELNFQRPGSVSVFETTIRILGGLLSAHLLAVDPKLPHLHPPGYDGGLLRMAKDLGDRLMPAFQTSTSIPFGTIDMTIGVPRGETTVACTAAAGSLVLELGMLSHLTNNSSYGEAARSALKALHDLRSDLSLFGRHIDIQSGRWTETLSGIGSNVDSIYEYLLKSYILFGDDQSLEWFTNVYSGAMKHLRIPNTRFYHEADMKSGNVQRNQLGALQAFWPGLQVLVGDLTQASKTLNGFLYILQQTRLLPEDFDLSSFQTLPGSGSRFLLRPELIESVFYMHQATKDDTWLFAGKDILESIESHTRVPCGYASIEDVSKMTYKDHMPSYFLSETLKYLYLLFTPNNFLHEPDWIFTTEAHPFRVTRAIQKWYETHAHQQAPVKPARLQVNDRAMPSLREDHYTMRTCPAAGLASGGSALEDEEEEEEEEEDEDLHESYYRLDPGFAATPHAEVDARMRPFASSSETGRPKRSNPVTAAAAEALEKIAERLRKTTQGGSAEGEASSSVQRTVTRVSEALGDFAVEVSPTGFEVKRLDTGDWVQVSNVQGPVVSVLTSTGSLIFVAVSGGWISSETAASQATYGTECVVRVSFRDVCAALTPLLPEEALPSRLVECAPSHGFGPSLLSGLEGFRDVRLVEDSEEDPEGCGAPTEEAAAARTEGVWALMAKRGKCAFETKARRAKRLGASLVVVSLVDPKDEELFVMSSASSSPTPEEARRALLEATPGILLKRADDDLLRAWTKTRALRVDVELPKRAGVSFRNRELTLGGLFEGWESVIQPTPKMSFSLLLRQTD